tara:strand:- start:553 stop:663 length:111 start_codon:yes stop_codon:yes gene_type:complete
MKGFFGFTDVFCAKPILKKNKKMIMLNLFIIAGEII